MNVRALLSLAGVTLTLTAASVGAQIAPTEYAARRAALAAKLQDGVVLALGSGEPTANYLSFWQNPFFDYLTGIREPDAALVMVKRANVVSTTLFVAEKVPAQEVWTGRRLGPDVAASRTALATRTTEALKPTLDSLLKEGGTLYVIRDQAEGGEFNWADEKLLDEIKAKHPSVTVKLANQSITQLRGTKSAAELALIRRAAAITVLAHEEAARALEPGMNEFEVQGLVDYTFRRNGGDRPSFSTIIGSGPNSTVLHYNANDRFMAAGDVVVMDIGAQYRSYAADVTRTLPVSGTFSPAQRAIYQTVRDAQASAERQAKPGIRARQMSDSASAALQKGLAAVGLIEAPGATYDCGPDGKRSCPQLQLYYMHGLGHGIGLDVHDPDQYYFTGTLQEGSAFTIEPGIYVRDYVLETLPDTPRNRALIAKLRPAVTTYQNIGVRIEDDYIITATGVEWISRAPREIAEIEAMMAKPNTGAAKRDAKLVDAYKSFLSTP